MLGYNHRDNYIKNKKVLIKMPKAKKAKLKKPLLLQQVSKKWYWLLGIMFALIIGAIGAYIIVSSEASDGTCTLYTWEEGDVTSPNGCVGDLQNALNEAHFDLTSNGAGWLEIDGDFGKLTRAKVVWLQGAEGISQDGIVGPQTWGKLCRVLRNGDHGPADYYNIGCFNPNFPNHI